MATRIYRTPFAATGDKEALATTDQPNGKVSLQAGWTPDYELPGDNPNYRPVGRAEMNGVLAEITEGLGEIQLNGFALWQSIEGGWPVNAYVAHEGKVYRSTIGANTTEPGDGGENWVEAITNMATTAAAGILAIATTAQATAGVDDQTAMTPAKTFAAINATSLGRAQSWQDVTASRANNVNYTNSTGRPIAFSVAANATSGGMALGVRVNGILVGITYSREATPFATGSLLAIVPPGATYSTSGASIASIVSWLELR